MGLSKDEIEALRDIKSQQRKKAGHVEPDEATDEQMREFCDDDYVLRAAHSTTDRVYHLPERDGTICSCAVWEHDWREVSLDQADFNSWSWCSSCRRAVAKNISDG